MRVFGASRRVLLVVDVDPAHVACELGDPLDLLDGERSQRGIDFGVLADDDDVHAYSSFIRRSRSIESGGSPLSRPRCTRHGGRQHLPRTAGVQRTRAPRSTWRPWSRRRRRRGRCGPRSIPRRTTAGPHDVPTAAPSSLRRTVVTRQELFRIASDAGRDDAREQRTVVDASCGAPAGARRYPGDDVDRERRVHATLGDDALRANGRRCARCDTSRARPARARRPRTRTQPSTTRHPRSGAAGGAARIAAAHGAHTGSARRPQPGQRPGRSAVSRSSTRPCSMRARYEAGETLRSGESIVRDIRCRASDELEAGLRVRGRRRRIFRTRSAY